MSSTTDHRKADKTVITSDNSARSDAADSGLTYVEKDKYRYWWFTALWPTAICLLSGWAYFASGGNAFMALIPITFVFVATPLIDMVLGEDNSSVAEHAIEAHEDDPWYRWILFAMIPQHYLIFVAGMWFLVSQPLPWWALLGGVAGLGTVNGVAMVLGHELGHKPRGSLDWIMAKVAVGANGYGHFYIEHNRGHHVKVATPEDCASARMGETVFEFALRELPGNFVGAVEKETARLEKRGLPFFCFQNDLLQCWGISLILAIGLTVWLGWGVIPFIILHHLFSWYTLTMSNYVAHYGLLRQKKENGKYERIQPRHSWNANHTFSNLMLIDLQRHSDHHANPMRYYHVLQNYADIPRLPLGYLGSMAVSNIPPVWFALMDKRVADWADGDMSLVHMQPGRGEKLFARFDRKNERNGEQDGHERDDEAAAIPAE